VSAVAIQRDGKIVVAGVGSEGAFVLARYLPSGALDTAFSGDGKVVTDFSISGLSVASTVSAVAIQPDGKIIIAGWASVATPGGVGYRGYDFALVRYMPNGAIDWTFGKSGKVVTTFQDPTCDLCRDASNDQLHSIVLQPDGKILAAGFSFVRNGGQQFALARYLPNGTLDRTFGGDGLVTSDCDGCEINAIALQPDGKIVVAGVAYYFDFALARYLTNGALDTTFDGDGKLITDIGSRNAASAIVIQPDGKIVVAGGVDFSDDDGNGDSGDFLLVRYLKNGALDRSFGGDGIVTTDFGTGWGDGISSLAIQSDGKIVAAGSSGVVALASYDFAGNLDPSFGIGGRVLTDSSGGAAAMAIQPKDGRLVVVGTDNILRYHAITCGGFGATLVGTPASEIIVGTSGPDVIRGFGGNDTIYGLAGNDYLCGSTGNDSLRGGPGNDALSGGNGDDDLRGGIGMDLCDGGAHTTADVVTGCETIRNVP
jgi:uncharacterized delta-60 repeat protein